MSTKIILSGILIGGGYLLMSSAVAQQTEPAQLDAEASNPEQNQLLLADNLYTAATKANGGEQAELLAKCIPIYERILQNFPETINRQFINYRLGVSYLMAGDRMNAVRYLNELIIKPAAGNLKASAAYRLGGLSSANNQFSEAIDYYSIVLQSTDQDNLKTDAYYRIGRAYAQLKKNPPAIQAFKKVVENKAADNAFRDSALLYLGNLYLAEAKDLEAFNAFDQLTGPSTSIKVRGESMIKTALLATRLGKLERAQELYQQIMREPALEPWRKQAKAGLLVSSFKQEKWQEVIRVSEPSIGAIVVEEDLRRLQMRATAFFKLKRYADASRTYLQIEREHPHTKAAFEATYQRLVCSYQLRSADLPRQVDSFIEIYQPKYAESTMIDRALLMKAEALSAERNFTEAADAYKALEVKALDIKQQPDALFKSGWVFHEIGDYVGAIPRLNQLIENHPKYVELASALVIRGHSLAQTGDHVGAQRDFERVVKDYAKSDYAAYSLQQLALMAGTKNEFKLMISYFEKLLKDYPKLKLAAVAEAHHWIGRGYFEEKAYAKALPHFKEAKTLVPEKYSQQDGMSVVLCYYYLQDVENLGKSIDSLLVENPDQKIAAPVLIWQGLQSFKLGNHQLAERYMSLASDPAEPKTTRNVVWKVLTKCRIEMKHYQSALNAVNFFLLSETENYNIAEANIDKAKILLALNQLKEAREAAMIAQNLNPQGALLADMRMVQAEISFKAKEYEAAAKDYLLVSELFAQDEQMRPRALKGAIASLNAAGKKEEAQKLQKEYDEKYGSN